MVAEQVDAGPLQRRERSAQTGVTAHPLFENAKVKGVGAHPEVLRDCHHGVRREERDRQQSDSFSHAAMIGNAA
ncbi:hypothetical protein Acsp02_56160 [Actinoplanes sp. NBRC 103695]|nr:hypothetical protein Acsp02_56160 [Actinoplanes sp. NBRC 103695]